MKVAIIGAGWSGLTLAYLLSKKQNIFLTIFEASSIYGGRAKSFTYKDYSLDNGQHIMLGAYHNMLNIIKSLDIKLEQVFNIYNMQWHAYNGICLKNIQLPFKTLNQNARLKFLFSIILAKKLSIQEKFSFIKIMTYLHFNDYKVANNILTVQNWLSVVNMPQSLQKQFFYPLCISALNTPVEKACIKRFMAVLHNTIGSNHILNSQLLIPKISLEDLYVKPIIQRILNNQNNKIYKNALVNSIHLNADNKFEISMNKQLPYFKNSFDKVIIAANYYNAQKILFNSNLSINDLAINFPSIEYFPITTLYVETDAKIAFEQPFLVYKQAIIFQKSDNIWAIVYSAQDIDNQSIGDLLHEYKNEFKQEFKLIKKVCEKKATYACVPSHPPIKSKIMDNLYLIGDYLHEQYPATLEAAISSAIDIEKYIN